MNTEGNKYRSDRLTRIKKQQNVLLSIEEDQRTEASNLKN